MKLKAQSTHLRAPICAGIRMVVIVSGVLHKGDCSLAGSLFVHGDHASEGTLVAVVRVDICTAFALHPSVQAEGCSVCNRIQLLVCCLLLT